LINGFVFRYSSGLQSRIFEYSIPVWMFSVLPAKLQEENKHDDYFVKIDK